jgi:hypothetical protein
MPAEEYRQALAALGYTQQGFARILGYSPRTGQKWALGETRLPGCAVILLRLLISRPELKPVVDGLALAETRKRSPAKRRPKASGRGA